MKENKNTEPEQCQNGKVPQHCYEGYGQVYICISREGQKTFSEGGGGGYSFRTPGYLKENFLTE